MIGLIIFQREGVGQGKIRRSHVALRHQFILNILKNLPTYQLPMEELEKYRVALTMRWEKEQQEKKMKHGSKGLRIAISQVLGAIEKAEQ